MAKNLLSSLRGHVLRSDYGPAIGLYAHRDWLRDYKWLLFFGLFAFSVVYGFAISIFSAAFLIQLTVPLLMLAGLMLWVLPEKEVISIKKVHFAFCVFFYALLCWPDYLAIAIPGLPWITMLRLAAVVLAGCFLIKISTSIKYRNDVKAVIFAESYIFVMFTIFMLTALLTIPMSAAAFSSINKFITAQLVWTLPLFASIPFFLQRGSSSRFVTHLWIISILLCAVALYEVVYSKLPWADRIPFFLKIEDESVLKTLSGSYRAFTTTYRVQSKFGVPLGLGEFIAITFPLILHKIFYERKLLTAVLGGLTIALMFFIVIKTDSRLAFIGFFSSILLYTCAAAYSWWRHEPKSIAAATVFWSYPAVAAAFLTLSVMWHRLAVMIWGGGAQQSSTGARKIMYQSGLPLIMSNPVGHGMGQGAITLGFYDPSGFLTIDTYYLAVALEYGVIGFVAYYSIFLVGALRAAKFGLGHMSDPDISYLLPLAIAFVNFIISKSVFSQQENHPLIFIFLGMLVTLSYRIIVGRRYDTASSEAASPGALEAHSS